MSPPGWRMSSPHDYVRGGGASLTLPVPLCRRDLLLSVATDEEKEHESEEREAGEHETLTFVAFLPLSQFWLIGESHVYGAESRRLIRTSLRRRLGRRGRGRE